MVETKQVQQRRMEIMHVHRIPGCIKAGLESGSVVIRWTGGVPLQSADTVNGPWSVVNGATSPYTAPGGTAKFYRPKIP